MNIKRIFIPLLLILFMASMAAFGAPVYVNVGPTTEFDGDIKILSEIVAEGTTPDDWETTVFFTDPTADNTITVPDSDQTIGTCTTIAPVAISGLAADVLAGADLFVFYDDTGSHLNNITWTNLMGSITALGGMSGAIATPTNISMTGELDMTGANVRIDLNPAGTGSEKIVCVFPTAALVAGSDWDAFCIDADALDPLTGGNTFIHGLHFDFSGVVSADGDDAITGGTYILLPTGDTGASFAHTHALNELTVAGSQTGFSSLGGALALSATATYRGLWVDWDGITRDGGAPILEGMRVELPADYTAYGTSFSAYFSGGGETVTICDGTNALGIGGMVRAGVLGTELPVLATEYGVAWYYFGDNADVTALRSRAVLKTTDAPTRTATGAIIQASNDDDINVLALNGALIEAIGKSTANASTITHMRGAIIGSEWNDFDTVVNLKTLYVRTHTRNSAGAGFISGTGYLIYAENEAVGGNGQQLDAGIYLKATNVSTPKAFDYGIDLSGAAGEINTADIRLSYGETISNTIDGIIALDATTLDFGTTREITVDTGGVLNMVLGNAAGDDFTIDTKSLVVSGDTGYVGMGTTTPVTRLNLSHTDYTFAGAGLSFGDGDSGFSQTSDDVIKVTIAGGLTGVFAATGFYMNIAVGPKMMNESATATNPTLIPNKSDGDTGIGQSDTDTLSLIAGNTEMLKLDQDNGYSYFSIGNVGIATSTFSANAVSTLQIANGTAPTAHLDDTINIYSVDSSDATATLGLFLEQVVEAVGTFTETHKVKVLINGVEYWIALDTP